MHFKPKLSSLVNQFRHQSLRYYRFGNRVRIRGFYLSNEELNRNHLKQDFDSKDDNKLGAEELRLIRNKLFDDEKKRQSELVSRIEKIVVSVIDPFGLDTNEKVNLLMNKDVSTPLDCSKHIDKLITDRSIVALIDDKTFWDMHRPLTGDCTLRFKHFKEANPHFVNKTFWKSCSLMMGSIIEKAFKDNVDLKLHSWPKPDLNSGSFVYDVYINLKHWKTTSEELRILTAMLQKLSAEDIPFERLDVNKDLAKKIFEHNSFKQQQVDSIASSRGSDEVTLYRIKDHIDISCGPLISNTSQMGSVFVTAIHPLTTDLGPIYRFQGIAIPRQLNINSFVLSILRERAQKQNPSKFFNNEGFQAISENEEWFPQRNVN